MIIVHLKYYQSIRYNMSSNEWNDFQHEHAGEGLSSGEMSEMYHAEQDTGDSGAELTSATDMTNTIGDVTDGDSGLVSEVNSDFDTQPDNSNDQGEESTSSGNQWNDFQHDHAGEGLSKTEMSEMYHDAQDSQDADPSTSEIANDNNNEESVLSENTPTENTEVDPTSNDNPHDDPQETSQDQSGNQWNEFEHQHKGEGKTPSELADMYHQQQQQSEDQSNQQPQQEETVNIAEESASQTTPNEWNQFQHEHKGENLTPQQMSDTYHQQQQEQQPPQEETANTAEESASQTTPNEWNQFQHEHKGENLTPQQMSDMYQQQQISTANNTQETTSQSTANEWNQFQHEHKGENLMHQQMSDMYHQQQQISTANNTQEGTSQSAINDWNKFQHEHRDENLSHEQMSAMYHQQKQSVEQEGANKPTESENVQRNRQSISQGTNGYRNRQNQPKQKTNVSVHWNQHQHLYRGKGLTKEEMANKYREFKRNERTFQWHDDYKCVITSDGKLRDPDTPAGREALKTGLFDEQNCLRRKGELPFNVFEAKLSAMGFTDRKQISSMYWNMTGSTALHASNLRQSSYRRCAATATTRRDADHILELQLVAGELCNVHLSEEDFHTIRSILNGRENIESRGIKVNRCAKRIANGGIARNHVELKKFVFEQELVQAEQAIKLANLCQEQGALDAATVLRHLADKCTHLHSIHEQVMQLNTKTKDSNENCELERRLTENIHSYEKEYGPVNFYGSRLTKYRAEILDKVHSRLYYQ